MKKFLIANISALICVVGLYACEKDKGDYPSFAALATIRMQSNSTNSYYFELDDDELSYVGDKSLIGSFEPKEGDRFLIYFNKLDQKLDGYEYNFNLYSLYSVPLGDTIITND